ncbi:Holliday junction resolvase RecU [Macrococcoides caseolyticum]|uniref:Holliday junction resolvase RecU n=1 Tax=Macrococcoides caseolyticum TaxID=69966 RepID=UPI001F25E421|nr:Holliday junction resolvase RecU [Macrococcus caseolyticus]MCE4957045.1 Holliday junction resolvase RecU [Macrococcus caseolyticus]
MVNYPNGKIPKSLDLVTNVKKHSKIEYGKRGMKFEDEIDLTNRYYLQNDIAIIHKKPTPIQIVKVDYPKRAKAVIKEAYFRRASTTDYNGIFQGKHIDFEAKATQNKTSFPLINIHTHQVDHMHQIHRHGGIVFVLICFSSLEEVYLLPFKHFFKYWQRYLCNERKSIQLNEIKKDGILIPYTYRPRIDYLKALTSNSIFKFNERED